MLDRLQDVFACFESHRVRYVVIGGIASVLHGVPRATFDLDILIDSTPENAKALLDALADAGLGTSSLTTAADILANEITVFQDVVRIDVQTLTPGLSFDTAWRNRVRMEYRGHAIYVASKPDLIASKEAAGRPVDLEDVRLLRLPDEGTKQ